MTDDAYQELLAVWPNCSTPDCENKRCCWSGTSLCARCAERRYGKAAVDRAYMETHPNREWDGSVAVLKDQP